jgi:ubiquinone/menaquinone biosynthesis C-methylase UbiE
MQLSFMEYFACPSCNGDLKAISSEENSEDSLKGTLRCRNCEERFETKNGVMDFTYPKLKTKADRKNEELWEKIAEMHTTGKNYDRRWLLFLGIWSYALREKSARRQLIRRLELKDGQSVLEVSSGTGANLEIISDIIGKTGVLHGLDISSGMVRIAQQKFNKKGRMFDFVKGNASYLPYRAEKFDAVFHLGAINQFYTKRRAIEEMCRVAKKGAKVVICDEGLSPERERSLLGKWILKFNPFMFHSKPPVKLIPNEVKELKVYWVFQNTFWVIEFRK